MNKLALAIILLLPALLQAQTYPVNGNGGNISSTNSACVPTACIGITVSNVGTISVTVTGTFSATLAVESSTDGSTFSSAGSNITTTGTTTYATTGVVLFRVRASAFVSGSAAVNITTSTGGGGGAPTGAAGGDLSGNYPNPNVKGINGTALSGLGTGILKNTTGTGVPSIAVAGDFPTLNQNTTGTAAALAGTPTICGASQVAQGITSNGNATGCTAAGIGFGANIVVPAVLQGGSLQMGNCTYTSGSPNVTCPNALWDSSMVGYLIRANASNTGNAFATTATVQSVTDATHIVINANASLSVAGTGSVGLYPRDETAQFNSAIATTLSITNCGTVAIPRGIYLITSAFSALNAGIPAGCTQWGNGASPGLQIVGYPGSIQGKATNLVIPADFDWSTCTVSNTCFTGGSGLLRCSDFNFIGQQQSSGIAAGAAGITIASCGANNFGVHHIGDTVTRAGFQSFALPGNGSKCLRCVFDATGPVNWGGFFGSFSGYMEGGVYVIIGSGGNFQANSDGTEVDGVSFTAAGGKAFFSQGSRLVAGSISGASTTVRSSTTGVDFYCDGCVMGSGGVATNAFLATGGNGLRVHATHLNMSGYTNMLNGPVTMFDDCGNVFSGGLGSWTSSAGWFGDCSVTGTTLATGNIALTSGWDTSTKGTISGSSTLGQFTVTLAGTPTSPGVITITFPNAFQVAPICTMLDVGGTNAVPTSITTGTVTTTTAAFTVNHTPVAGNTEVFQYSCRIP